jgi:hypothetical protein
MFGKSEDQVGLGQVWREEILRVIDNEGITNWSPPDLD